MNKYIDAEKLIAKINERLMAVDIEKLGNFGSHRVWAYNDVKDIIGSLQQEQPMPDSTKLIELWHQDKEMLKEKDFHDDPWRLAYNAFMCGFGRGIAVNKQERPEVDFEEEWEKFEDFVESYNQSDYPTCYEPKQIARHFYELGLNEINK